MNAIGKDIFRAIHEGKWLYIEYQNKDSERTKYWIAIHDIDLEKGTLEVTGLHIGIFTTKKLSIFIETIITSYVMEGTYYKTNTDLIDSIEAFPQKYSGIFSNIANLKVLNYLADCDKLSDVPKLNTKYELVNKLDSSKITNRMYTLDDEQFKQIVNSFKKRAEIAKEDNKSSIMQIALNELSIHTKKGLYVLAYREVRLDVEKRILIAGNKIKICTEFCMDDSYDTRNKLSIFNIDLSLIYKYHKERYFYVEFHSRACNAI